jgi:anti-sigma B factor antagonist
LTPQFEEALKQLLADHKHNIIVDMSQVTYINSGGLRCLITARRLSRQQGGDIVLCSLSRRLAEVFEMVGLDQVLIIYNSRDRASAHFSPESP